MVLNARYARVRTVGLIAGFATLTGANGVAAPASSRTVVAVFAIENEGADLEASIAERIAGYVGAQLVAHGRYLVVPRAELRKALAAQKADSYRACFDESCQIEVGKEVAAEKSLAGVVARIGSRCIVTLKLYDLAKSAQEAAGVAKGTCDQDGILDSVERALQRLVGPSRRARTPPLEPTDYRALMKHTEAATLPTQKARAQLDERRTRLADAWGIVSKLARTSAVPPAIRKAAVDNFIDEYSIDNPHLEAARAFAAALGDRRLPLEEWDMVRVPGGPFIAGCTPGKDERCDHSRRRRVAVQTFFIDRTEVTVAAYRSCVQAGRCSAKAVMMPVEDDEPQPNAAKECNWNHPDRDEHPINCVDWYQARDYCRWRHKRLPSEREWEKAARGIDGRPFPWGSKTPSDQPRAVIGWSRGSTAPVGSAPAGVSVYGATDMTGNVWEWTINGDSAARWRGGSFASPLVDGLTYRSRHPSSVSFRARHIGFRCVSTKPTGPAPQ